MARLRLVEDDEMNRDAPGLEKMKKAVEEITE
jgi:hypothetical protein